MSVNQIKALIKAGRGQNWIDERPRSPKALGDMSGVILSRIGANHPNGVQDFDYETLAKVYICNDLAWTCIDLVSSTAALGRLRVRRRDGKSVEYLPDHPLQRLLDFPNPSMTQFDLIQAYATHQKLFGTVGMLLLREPMTELCPLCAAECLDDCAHKLYYWSEGPVLQIMPVHPSTLQQSEVTVDGRRRRMFFYTPEPGKKYLIHPDNLLTDPLYNTDASWYGVSPTFLLKRWLDLDDSMTRQVTQFFQNGAIPSMIINMRPGTNYTYEQEPETLVQMMKEKWMEQFRPGSPTAKAPAFTYGDISVERLSEKIEEVIAKGLYYEIQNRVCATFGVPPTLYEMGMRYSSQRSNAVQGEKDFYNRTISKVLRRLESKITQLVVPSYGEPGLEVVWDLSEMGIASFIISEKKAEVKKDWELGLISRDQARVQLGYEPVGGELGDDFYRLTVMSDGKNQDQAAGMDNRLRMPQADEPTSTTDTVATPSND